MEKLINGSIKTEFSVLLIKLYLKKKKSRINIGQKVVVRNIYINYRWKSMGKGDDALVPKRFEKKKRETFQRQDDETRKSVRASCGRE